MKTAEPKSQAVATDQLLFGYPLGGEPRWLRPGVAATGLIIIGLGVLLRRGARHDGRSAP